MAEVPAPADRPGAAELLRLTYGPDPSQFALLARPEGRPRGVVVVIHGGFWKAQYGVELAEPLALDLAGHGWAALAVEYRRVGIGGGYPQTFDDLHAAIGLLADPVLGLDLGAGVITLGHSAGGHLALWAAARHRFPRWAAGAVAVRAVIDQAGVADLAAAFDEGLGSGAVEAFVGPPGPHYDEVDPSRQLPLEVPVWCVHAPDDEAVPYAQSTGYVERAGAAGAQASLVPVTGGHFGVIDPGHAAWAVQLELLDALAED